MNAVANNPEQLGNAIRRERRKRGVSQGALGAKLGLRQGTISVIEKGKPGAKLETILAILAALDLELQVAPRSSGATWDIERI
jgi:HTH-type transcriptional regulator/antitoxin HipB